MYKAIGILVAFAAATLPRAETPSACAADSSSPAKPIVELKPRAVTLTFAVNVNGRVHSYSDTIDQDVSVLLPLTSPWRCIRRRVQPPAAGMIMGSFVCSADPEGTTEVVVSTSCGVPGESHNSATLVYSGPPNGSFITLKVDCVAVDLHLDF